MLPVINKSREWQPGGAAGRRAPWLRGWTQLSLLAVILPVNPD